MLGAQHTLPFAGLILLGLSQVSRPAGLLLHGECKAMRTGSVHASGCILIPPDGPAQVVLVISHNVQAPPLRGLLTWLRSGSCILQRDSATGLFNETRIVGDVCKHTVLASSNCCLHLLCSMLY